MRQSRLERAADAIFSEFCRKHDIGLCWQPQFKFDPDRNWRADFLVYHERDYAWDCPGNGVIVEIEGLFKFGKTRHQESSGYVEDCKKYNSAQLLGWKVLRYTERMLADGSLDRDLKDFFGILSTSSR